jgi:hypothetical protein
MVTNWLKSSGKRRVSTAHAMNRHLRGSVAYPEYVTDPGTAFYDRLRLTGRSQSSFPIRLDPWRGT